MNSVGLEEYYTHFLPEIEIFDIVGNAITDSDPIVLPYSAIF